MTQFSVNIFVLYSFSPLNHFSSVFFNTLSTSDFKCRHIWKPSNRRFRRRRLPPFTVLDTGTHLPLNVRYQSSRINWRGPWYIKRHGVEWEVIVHHQSLYHGYGVVQGVYIIHELIIIDNHNDDSNNDNDVFSGYVGRVYWVWFLTEIISSGPSNS